MAEKRHRTTLEERREIVEYCIHHGRNYKEAAQHFGVSYSLVYKLVNRYDDYGEEGLLTNKPIHRSPEEEAAELERLRREYERVKREVEEKKREVEMLRKVMEFDRR